MLEKNQTVMKWTKETFCKHSWNWNCNSPELLMEDIELISRRELRVNMDCLIKKYMMINWMQMSVLWTLVLGGQHLHGNETVDDEGTGNAAVPDWTSDSLLEPVGVDSTEEGQCRQ